jgi:hypothetical protein
MKLDISPVRESQAWLPCRLGGQGRGRLLDCSCVTAMGFARAYSHRRDARYVARRLLGSSAMTRAERLSPSWPPTLRTARRHRDMTGDGISLGVFGTVTELYGKENQTLCGIPCALRPPGIICAKHFRLLATDGARWHHLRADRAGANAVARGRRSSPLPDSHNRSDSGTTGPPTARPSRCPGEQDGLGAGCYGAP